MQTSKCVFVVFEGFLSDNSETTTGSVLEKSNLKFMNEVTDLGGTTLLHKRKESALRKDVNEQNALLMQLLDYYDPIEPIDEEEEKEWSIKPEARLEKQSLYCKFKKLKVKVLTNNKEVLPVFEHRKETVSLSQLPTNATQDVHKLAEQCVLDLINENNDILLIHVHANQQENTEETKKNQLEAFDLLLKEISQLFQEKQNKWKLYLSLLFSCPFGKTLKKKMVKSPFQRPTQSYELKNGRNIKDIVNEQPSCILIEYCPEEIRKDYNNLLTEQSCLQHAGNSEILIDFVFYQIAYKLHKSSKYGA
ncbi:hypothetical protein ABK040_001795 [Willaertia magna]